MGYHSQVLNKEEKKMEKKRKGININGSVFCCVWGCDGNDGVFECVSKCGTVCMAPYPTLLCFSFAFVQPALLQALFHPLPSLNFFLLYNFLPLNSLAFINSPHAAHIMQNPNQTMLLSGGLTYAPAACLWY